MINALKVVWIFYSLLITVMLVIFTAANDELLINKTPLCQSISENNTECIACGMTRGINAAAKGRLYDSMQYNSFSIYLYTVFLLNTVLFSIYAFKKFNLSFNIFPKLNETKYD